ncbi:MAG: RNA polymerase sigma factor [Burkholderiaceae bacterium]
MGDVGVQGPEEAHERDCLRRIAEKAEGSEACARAIFLRYAKPCFAYCKRHGFSDDEAEDLVQQTFIKVFTKAGTYKGDAKVSTWIYRIHTRTVLDEFRRLGRHRKNVDDNAPVEEVGDDQAQDDDDLGPPQARGNHGGEPPRDVEQRLRKDCVDDAFARFAKAHPRCAMALRAFSIFGWSIREVADMLDTSETATTTFLADCRKRFKPFVAPCLDV